MKKFLGLILLLAGSLRAASFGSPGTAGEDFLKIPISTRAAGMGGAMLALSDDLSALEFNPARLSQLDGFELSGGHLSYFAGINMENLSLGYGGHMGGLGLLYQSLNSPTLQALDSSGNPDGTFSENDMAVTLGGGTAFGPFQMGLNLRLANRALAGLDSLGYSADVGLGLDLGAGFGLGLTMQNLGSEGSIEQVADPLPLTLRGGLGWKKEDMGDLALRIEADAVQPWDSSIQVRGGAELAYADSVMLRLGGQWSQAFDSRQSFSAGVGLKLRGIQVDYAYTPFDNLGTAQRISLSLFWNALMHPGISKETRLGHPVDLKVKESNGGLDVTWEAPRVNDKRPITYVVYVRRGADAQLKRITNIALTRRHLFVKGLQAGLEYGLAVAAVDADGKEGDQSSELKFKSGEGKQKLGPPEPPKKLRINKRKKGLHLSWDASASSGPLVYQVYVSTRTHDSYAPLEKPASDTNLDPDFEEMPSRGKALYFTIKALRPASAGGAESEFSEEAIYQLH